MSTTTEWKEIFAVAALTAISAAAQGGTVVNFDSDSKVCPGDIRSLKVDGGRFRVDTQAQGYDGAMLSDHAERMMTSLMHDQRQYLQIEVDEDALDYQGDVAHSTGNSRSTRDRKRTGPAPPEPRGASAVRPR